MIRRVFRVGHEYRDRVGFPDDELSAWLSTEAGTISNGRGVRFKDPINNRQRDEETDRAIPAYFLLITSDKSGQHHNPWDDVVDENSGNIHYWGDAKFKTRQTAYNKFPGNARLEAANNLRLSGVFEVCLHFFISQGNVRDGSHSMGCAHFQT